MLGLVLAGVLLVLGAAGCGGDEAGAPTRSDLPYELYCDIGNADCQRRIYDSVAAMLEAEGFERPSIRTISVEQHAEEVRASVSLEDLTGEDPATRGLRAMGFIPEASESVTATQIEYWISQIAAYYRRDSHSITVVDRQYDEIDAQVLLAHELIHAIQNSQFNLNSVGARADTEDGVLGVRSVIEGDAMHSSFAWGYELLGFATEDIDWDAIHHESQDSLRERAADPEIALIDTASSFPYSYGFDFMTQVLLRDGLAGRTAAFQAPPTTAYAVMLGYRAELPVFVFPPVAHPAPLDGSSLELANRFGAWYLYGILRRLGASDEAAWASMLDWRGDELSVYQNGDDVVAVWRLRFGDAKHADALGEEINAEGRDAARTAVLLDEEVFVFAAESAEVLLAWAELPLDSMTASIVPKAARHRGGAVSVGDCLKPRALSLPIPPPVSH